MAFRWRPYVRVSQRRAQASRLATALAKQGKPLAPVRVTGRNIATTFWGQSWCENLERYSDFANRLPRGRTYVRNGSVIDLQIQRGQVQARVSGSDIYTVEVNIRELPGSVWKVIKRDCAESIQSLLDLLQGRFSQGVMARLTRPQDGLFPHPKEISMRCSCPDWAVLCKHVAAVLYGVGARLDTEPELLFQLRAVDHLELVQQALATESLEQALDTGRNTALAGQDLGELFGIELEAKGSSHSAGTVQTAAKKRAQPKSTRSQNSGDKVKAATKPASRKKPVSRTTSKTAARTTRTAAKVAKRTASEPIAMAEEATRAGKRGARKAAVGKPRKKARPETHA